jgi:hypothetical protein
MAVLRVVLPFLPEETVQPLRSALAASSAGGGQARGSVVVKYAPYSWRIVYRMGSGAQSPRGQGSTTMLAPRSPPRPQSQEEAHRRTV